MTTGTGAPDRVHDVCVIGSGFGGSMAARKLVRAGLDVAMIERGDWVPRGPHNWHPDGSIDLTPYYTRETPYRVEKGGNNPEMGIYSCVGGPSVFYGGVSLRYREKDFEPSPELCGDSGAAWPFGYDELEPYYGEAESILDVAGEADADPTDPHRSTPYPQPAAPLSELSRGIASAGERLGLAPFPLPLAINYRAGERACISCNTCDTFACAVSAKNDLATTVLPDLVSRGMTLLPRKVAVELVREGSRVVAVRCYDKDEDRFTEVRARWFVLAAGSLATPHLLLASGLHELNPAGELVGRFLMRHVNAIVFGFFPRLPGPVDTFHKQVGFHDFYFGHPRGKGPPGKLGSIQQLHTPPIGLVDAHLPRPLALLARPVISRMTGLLVMAEDQPSARNHVRLGGSGRWGLPQAVVHHRYTRRDRAANRRLRREAKRILRRAGALLFYQHKIKTFSHAVGTVRMGPEERSAPVDSECRFRGVDNLSIVDGSVLPTSAGLNPSLTISANALRAGELLSRPGQVK